MECKKSASFRYNYGNLYANFTNQPFWLTIVAITDRRITCRRPQRAGEGMDEG